MIGIFLQNLALQGQGADVSGLGYLAPILVFLLVVLVLALILKKTKVIGENPWMTMFISLIMAIIFVTANNIRELILNVIPWFAVLLIALFFILLLTTFVSADNVPKKLLVWAFLIAMIFVFFFSGVKVYASTLGSYIPGPYYGQDADPQVLLFFDWFYSPGIIGAFWLIMATVVVGGILIKFGGKK